MLEINQKSGSLFASGPPGARVIIKAGGHALSELLLIDLAEPPTGFLAAAAASAGERFDAISERLRGLDAILQLAKNAPHLDTEVRWALSGIQDAVDGCLALAAPRADEVIQFDRLS